MARALLIGAVLLTLAGVAAARVITLWSCIGDCDGDGRVRIAELIAAVSVAAGEAPLAACPSIACDGGARVAIACLIAAVNAAMRDRCGPPPDGREPCGSVLCPLGERCCNRLYSLCAPPDRYCIQ
ncbi:hypothetical protein KF840_04055 [bacterium]|nr:hypothetical protein [bacterium]